MRKLAGVVRPLIALALFCASCGAPVASTMPDPTAEFDVAHVREFWTQECANPQFVEPDVCEDINVAAMRGERRTLLIPTLLSPQDHTEFNRAQNACLALRFDGMAFGFELVAMLDSFGAPFWTCEVNPT